LIIIRFIRNNARYTYYISDNLALLLTFLVSAGVALIFRGRKIRKSLQEDIKKIPKGGEIEILPYIDQCLEQPDRVYEVVSPGLEIMLKRMLRITSDIGPIVVSPSVLIIAYVVYTRSLNQLSILGTDMVLERYRRRLISQFAACIGTGSLVYLIPRGFFLKFLRLFTPVTGGSVIVLLFHLLQNIASFDCNSMVVQLPVQYNSATQRTITILDKPEQQNNRIFVADESQNLNIYIPIPDDRDKSCSFESNDIESKQKLEKYHVQGLIPEPKPEETLSLKCNNNYVPLKYRTKTLSDLKREDSSDSRQDAQRYITRYENRRKRIMNDRK